MKKNILTSLLFFFCGFLFSQSITVNTSTYTVPQLVQNVLINSPCAQVSNFTSQGNCGIGYFSYTGSPANFDFQDGVIIRSGTANSSSGNYNGGANSSVCSGAGDAELAAISAANGNTGTINDASFVKFNFTPFTDNFSFNFIFASNEYGTYQCTFGDVFAFILTDITAGTPPVNLAVIPGTSTPVSVTNIRNNLYNGGCTSVNPTFFDVYSPNVTPATNTVMNMVGYTVPMTASATVIPNHNYTIKLVIGDYNDSQFDSAVFIEGGSFNVGVANLTYPIGLGGSYTQDMLVSNGQAVCPGETRLVSTGLNAANFDFVWTRNGVNLNIDAPSITVSQPGVYCVNASVTGGGACSQTDCITVEYFTGFPINHTPGDMNVCNANVNLNTQNTTILAGLDPSTHDVEYYYSMADAQNSNNPIPAGVFVAALGTTPIVAKVINIFAACPEYANFNVVYGVCTIPTVQPSDLILCDDASNNGVEVFNLSSQTSVVLGPLNNANYTVTYHLSQAAADAGTGAISPSNAYSNISNPQTIYIRVVQNSDPTVFNTSRSFQLRVVPQPVVSSFTGTTTICSGSSTNLTFSGTPNAAITYSDGSTLPNPTVLLDGSGNAVVSVSPTTTTTYNLVSIATSGTPGCSNAASGSVVVTVTQQVSGGTLSYALSSFCGSDATNYSPILTGLVAGTGACSGAVPTYSATPVGLTINPTTGVISPLTSLPGTYTITITYPACGSCPSYAIPAIITINSQPVAGSSGATLVCDNDSSTINLYSLITGESSGGTWTRSSGTGGTFDALAGTFIPALGATTSTFNYSVTGLAPCATLISTATVNINPQPQAGTDGSFTVCETSTTTIDLFSLITGEQSGGVWTRTGTGGTFNAAAGTFTPAVGATTSTFTYTLTGVAPCVNDSSVATVTINPQPIAGTDGFTTVCETSSATINLFSFITGEQPGGVWTRTGAGTGGTFNAAAGTFTPAVGATTSTFTYTLTGTAPCVDDTSVVTVNINAQPNAGTDATTTVCASSTAAIDLYSLITGEQTGGVWTRTSGTGGSFNAATGIFTPALGVTNSTFLYTLTGTAPCVNDSSIATVNFSAQPNAGSDGAVAICDNSTATINLFSLITGEQAGGTWIRTVGTGGVFDALTGTFTPAVGATTSFFTYTLSATAPCVSDSSEAVVTISSIPTGITISGTTTTCAGIPVNLTVTGTPGTLITWTGTPSSFTIGASGSNVISVAPIATTTYALTSASLNGCTIPVIGQSATVTVSATPQFVTQIMDFSICNGGTLNIASQLTSTVPGATFIWSATTSNLTTAVISGDETNIDQIVNLINPLQEGTINIEVKPQIGSCFGVSQQILVTVKPIPVITSTVVNKPVICNNETVIITSNSNPIATQYNWQINTATGVQIVGGATSGTTTTGIVNLQLALTDPLVSGTISFDFTPVNGICTGATSVNAVTITVNPIPGTPIGLPVDEICSGKTTSLTISSFPTIAGTTLEWTVIDSQNVTGFTNGTGTAPFTINDLLINTSNVQGFVKYSVTSKLGNCNGGTTEYIVRVNPLPKPNLKDGHICVNQTTGVTYQGYVLDTQLSNPNFTYEWFILNTTTNSYDTIAGATGSTYEAMQEGTYQVEVTDLTYSTNCSALASSAAVVSTIYPATAFTTVVTDAFTSNATITVTVNPIGTGNLIYSLDGGAWQSSNVFTGVEGGTHEIMVEDLEGCTNLTETIEVIDYPKYFTPNGDGFNDKWKIVGLEAKHNAKIYIFDRYGKLIKQMDPLGEGWDGKYNGQDIPSTDYWFNVDYTENNQQKQFKAHFSLKR
jgi:gliding motility-associated-like protein